MPHKASKKKEPSTQTSLRAKSLWLRWKHFSRKKVHDYPRDLPPRMVIKGTAIILLGPYMLLFILLFYGFLAPDVVFWSALFLFCIALIFITPYIANLSALTHYVRALATDAKAEAPDLSFLNNVEELQEAVEKLHATWESRGRQLQGIVEESRVLINSLPEILLLLDKKPNLIRANTTTRQSFGARTYKEIVNHILTSDEIAGAAKHVMESKEGRDLQYELFEPFHRHYMVHIEAYPDNTHSQIALLVVMHDITAQKQTERLLSDFVANASHEIRTPLTSVIGYLETMQTAEKMDKATRQNFLGIMKVQAERMAKLVKDLLSLSQIERSHYAQNMSALSVGNLLKNVQQQCAFNAEAKAKRMQVELEILTRKMPKVEGDGEQLRQVFTNLIENAFKYGRPRSTVKLTAEVVENKTNHPELQDYSHLVAVEVSDEGEGIPPEHLPRLTERFYRVDTARSRKIGGSGLGLSIVEQILDRHHAALEVESVVGEGSVFRVLLGVPEDEVLKLTAMQSK